MRRISTLLVFAVTLVCVGVLKSELSRTSQGQGPAYIEGEVVIKLKPGFGHSHFGAFGALNMEQLSRFENFHLLKYSTRVPMEVLLAKLNNMPQVEYAEPNYIYTVQVIDVKRSEMVNDPDFVKNWGLHNTGQKDKSGNFGEEGSDIDALKAWAVETGSRDVVVAVIDTGIDYNHEDLKDNMFKNAGEMGEYTDDEGNLKNKETDEIDNDGNGFVDDVLGWNFVKKTNDPMDDYGHGTHCAGTIGAVGGNDVGTVGVAWKVSMLPIKFLGKGGSGSLADAVKSIDYARIMKVNVMSNSWGGGGFSQTMADAIEAASKEGILFIAAAGNSNNNNDKGSHYPSSYESENVIAVAATDNQDKKAYFSSYGFESVDVSAPGHYIYSALPDNKYGFLSGTSMATPHVAGLAALLISKYPDETMLEIKKRILESTEELKVLRRKVANGRINAYNALMGIKPPRFQPLDPSLWVDATKEISSEHPYEKGKTVIWKIEHPGAKRIRVHFAKFETEIRYDSVTIKDAAGDVVDTYSGKMDPFWSFEAEGDTLEIIFKTDNYVEKYGFDIDKYQYATELESTPDPKPDPEKLM